MRSTVEVFARCGGGGPRGFRKQGQFAQQRPRPGDDVGFATAFRPQRKRAPLHDEGAVGDVAGHEQHLTRLYAIAFGADGEDAQRRRAKAAEHRDSLKERDVVLDRHGDRNYGTSL